MLDQLPDAVIALDDHQNIIGVNRVASSLVGRSADELTGQSCTDVLDPRDKDGKPLLAEGWHRSASLGSVRGLPEQEITLRRADGSDVRTYVTGSYQRDDNGRVTGLTLVLREGGRRQHQAVAGIEIVSTVSHELRAPLTSVKGYTSLLLNRWDRLKDDQKKMMLEQVNHDADRVTRLITELLDISRLETGRLVLRRQLVDVRALIDTIVEKVRMEYPDLDSSVETPEDFPRVYADPDKVEQVITNLVENACKYASTQGLKVVGELSPDGIAISVTDAGEGIPAEDLPKVFTKFFRRAEGKPTGSGLGLWISRGLVEVHGGKLEASSIVGTGTTFRFTLPLVDIDDLTFA